MRVPDAPVPAGPRLAGWLRELFPEPAANGPSGRAIALGVLGFLAAMGISISRTGGPGALNSIWIEDAKRFFNGAFSNSPATHVILDPFNGYVHVGPRIAAEFSSLFGVRWSAPVLTLIAVFLIASTAAIAFTASGRFFTQWWLRLLVAVPVVMVPVAHTQADNDIATVQFFAFYAMFWAVLWRPRTIGGKVVAILPVLYAGSCSILPVMLLPLLALRLWFVRDWVTRLMALGALAGLALQGFFTVTGRTSRDGIGDPDYNPIFLLKEYAGTAIPRALFGEKWLGGPGTTVTGAVAPLSIGTAAHIVLALVAWAIVAAIVLLALRRMTRPHWPLAIAAVGVGGLFFAISVGSFGWTQPRYVIPVALLFYVALAALLRPAPRAESDNAVARPRLASRVPVLAFVVLLAVVCAVNLRGPNGRSASQPWTETVRQAHAYCDVHEGRGTFQYRHDWWYVRIPCNRLG
ncbi:hypothetical protein [Asanoa hainanensis]|uniref:hypothetical protein n=1 Tax=Asanoa hainanensis TaxID=560556 RepID=UPI00117ECC76|nr:hypothetical protein [Asanoa hainanensis]